MTEKYLFEKLNIMTDIVFFSFFASMTIIDTKLSSTEVTVHKLMRMQNQYFTRKSFYKCKTMPRSTNRGIMNHRTDKIFPGTNHQPFSA